MTGKNFISGYGRKVALMTCLLLISVIAPAQTTAGAAQGSPYGIFVITGSRIIMPEKASDKSSGYLIERSGIKDERWNKVALLTAPGRIKDFESSLRYWCGRFPEWADFERIPVATLYPVLERTGTTDSLGFYGQLLPVRLAAGVVFLDSTITDTLEYRYRVTEASPAGTGKILFISEPVRIRESTFLGRPFIANKLVSADEVIITSGLDPGFRPPFYRVFRKKDGDSSFSRINPATVRFIRNDTSFVTVRDTEVEQGKVYSYYIVPVDYYGRVSVPSGIVRTGIYSFSSIRAPYSITTEAVLPAGGIRLRWSFDTPADIRNLNIYRSTDYDTGYVLLKKISPSDTLFTDMDVEPMRKYYYYLVMEGFFDELSSPGVRVYGIAENRLPPQRPVIAHAEAIKQGARLEMRYFNPDTRSIRLYRRIKGHRDFSPVAVIPAVSGESVSYTDTSSYFTGYTMLSYIAMVENTSYALSPFSDTVSVYPLSVSGPVAPGNLSVTSENVGVNLVWDDIFTTNPAVTGYRVYRRMCDDTGKKKKSFDLAYDGSLKPEVNYFTDTHVAEGSTYEYQVRSVDFKGTESTAGAIGIITIPLTRPVAPSGMKLLVQDTGIVVEWEEPDQEGISSYRLYRYERGKAPVMIKTTPRGTAEYTDGGALKGKLYFYYLTSVHENGVESTPGREEGIWRQ
jgi:fibronectin type 3 domain-containing protein